MNVNAALEPLLRDIEELVIDPKNARTHGDRNLAIIAESLDRYGQQKPVVYDPASFVVIAGNGMVQAARDRLNWSSIAAIPFDQENAARIRGFAVTDNRSGELSEWDFANLKTDLEFLRSDGIALDLLGWEDHELDIILNARWGAPNQEPLEEGESTTHATSIKVTPEQRDAIESAIRKCRELEGDSEMTEGRAVSIMALFYVEHVAGTL